MSETPAQQQQQPQQGYAQQQPFFPPPYQYQGSWPQGWGYVQTAPPIAQATPAPAPRVVIGEPPKKKRALDSDEEEATPVSAPTRGRGRGRGARGGHLWGWVRLGFYASKPPYYPATRIRSKIVQAVMNGKSWEKSSFICHF